MAVIVPGAEWRPNPVSSRSISLRWVILHTIVGSVNGSLPGRHYHIYVRANGSFVQIQDLLKRSAASVQANPYSIAITAEDKGSGFPAWSGNDVPAYTSAQVDTIVKVLVWIYRRFGLPPGAVRDTCLGGAKGTCWHRLGIDGNWPRWPSIFRGRENKACLATSLSTGKGCPGNRRISQINNVIIPRVAALLRDQPPPTEGFLMALTDAQQKEVYDWVRRVAVSTVPFEQDARPADGRFQVQALVRRVVREDSFKSTLHSAIADVFKFEAGAKEGPLHEIIRQVLAEVSPPPS